jgi:predicted secreted hydrolase
MMNNEPPTTTATGHSAYESETGGRIYHLPRDHALHGGPWYRGAEYQETNYFTGFFTDRKTGKPYSVFFCLAIYGYDKQVDRPLWVALFSMTDIERKKFAQCVHVMPGSITATGSGPNVPPSDFFAEYAIGKGVDGSEGLFSYRSAAETWRYVSHVATPNAKMPGDNRPYHLDLTAQVVKPGYQCPVPYGFTQEGLGTDVTNNLANPFTGAALSWYIIAPCMQMSGTLKCEDMDLELDGQAYYEHQWGRLRIPGMEQARYYWGWARMDDGRILNWRTYRDAKTGAYVPEDSANRFNVIHPDGRVQYFMGPAFRFEPTKSWKSPDTGVEYPLYGKMTTPAGVFYPEPVVDVAEAQLLNGGMWEGAARLRADRPDGPVVGRSFCEHMWAPFDSPIGKDIPYDAAITARRDGGLPEGKDFKLYTQW